MENTIGDRPQQVLDMAFDAIFRVRRRRRTHGAADHRFSAKEYSLGMFAPAAISEAARHHSLHPGFENCWHRKPPYGELEDHQVTPHDFFLLSNDVRRKSTMRELVFLLQINGHRVTGIQRRGKSCSRRLRIKTHCRKISLRSV